MKFTTVEYQGKQRFGLVEGDDIFLATDAHLSQCPSLKAAIANGLEGAAVRLKQDGLKVPLRDAIFAPVIPDAAQIYCVGLNYKKHRDETRTDENRKYPDYPIVFSRFATTLAAHAEALPKPANSDVVDYEGELAIIIGKECFDVNEADAMQYVAGYACFNDISMRDWQMRGEQWTPGKNFEKSGPLGPYMVTPEEAGPLDDLYLRTILDGKCMQEAPFRDLIFSVPTLISYISQFSRLMPGDIIAAGTPGGVGFTRNPPALLVPGSTIIVEIDKIGRLENTIVAGV